jgi:uridine phosphorylase
MARISEADLILNKDGSVYHLNLLPFHIADIVIAVGDPDRVEGVSKYFDKVEFRIQKREFVTHVGKLNGKPITVISTGMGTDNVEIFFTELDALVNIDLSTRLPKEKKRRLKVIRIGTSGALQEDIPLDTHLVTDYAIGFDTLMHFYNLEMDEKENKIANDIRAKTGLPFTPYVVRGSSTLLQQFGGDMIVGNTITTPGFYAPQGRILRNSLRHPELLEKLRSYSNEEKTFKATNFEMETAGYYSLARLLGHEALSVNAIIANRAKNKFSSDPNEVVDKLIKKVLDGWSAMV